VATKDLLALDQGELPEIPPLESEDVEDDEGGIAAPEHEFVEARSTFPVKADDLAIEHCMGIHFLVDEQS
jgi:hypothetical protein